MAIGKPVGSMKKKVTKSMKYTKRDRYMKLFIGLYKLSNQNERTMKLHNMKMFDYKDYMFYIVPEVTSVISM